MSVAKIVEAEGDTIEAAVEAAAEGTSRSVRNIQNVCARNFEAIIEDGSDAS